MRLLKMLLLLPFITLMAIWQSLVMFFLTYKMAWDMLGALKRERYL